MVTISSGAVCNQLILISAGRADEAGFTRRLVENYEAAVPSGANIGFESHDIVTAQELCDLLVSLADRTKSGLRPMLHIDMHGHQQNGVQIGASGEMLAWSELARLLRVINAGSNNNLIVLLTACFGMHQIREFTIGELTPAFVILAPEHEITFGEIEGTVIAFFKELHRTDDLDAARRLLPNSVKYWHCERMLVIAFINYYRRYCRGKAAAARKEELLTRSLTGGLANTRTNRRWIRKTVKKAINPDEGQFRRLAKRFLGPRKCSITWEQVQTALRSPGTSDS